MIDGITIKIDGTLYAGENNSNFIYFENFEPRADADYFVNVKSTSGARYTVPYEENVFVTADMIPQTGTLTVALCEKKAENEYVALSKPFSFTVKQSVAGGDSPPTYEMAKTLAERAIEAADRAEEIAENMDTGGNNAPALLSGKTIVCFGDSIIGMYRGEDAVTSYLAKHTGATAYNVGFGGCRMAIHPTAGYAEFSMWALAKAIAENDWTAQDAAASSGASYFPEQLALLKSIDFNKVDVAVIHYGTNDFPNYGTELDNENDSLDYSTICGALRYSIESLLTAYPHLRVFISVPVYRFWSSDGTVTYADTYTNQLGHKLIDVCDAITGTAREYNLPTIDGYQGMGVNKINATTFLQSDGTHHTVAGRERFGAFMGSRLIAESANLAQSTAENNPDSGNGDNGDNGDTGGSGEATAYTNQIPGSTDEDGNVYGWKTGYRLSSSGALSAASDVEVTGFIPCAAGDIIRLKNITLKPSGNSSYHKVCFYDRSKAFIGLVNCNAMIASLFAEVDENENISKFTVQNTADFSAADECAYFRLSADEIDNTSVITVNEVIE